MPRLDPGAFPAEPGSPLRRWLWAWMALPIETQVRLLKWGANRLGYLLVSSDYHRMGASQAVAILTALARLASAPGAMADLPEGTRARLLLGLAHGLPPERRAAMAAWLTGVRTDRDRDRERDALQFASDGVLEARRASGEERRHA